MTKNALGKGLSALLKEEVAPLQGSKDLMMVRVEMIVPGELQPRKNFDLTKIRELADSIIANGLIQPIVVNEIEDGKYHIIAGERRYRACKLAGLNEVPVIIKNLSSKEILEVALIENVQREELTAIEEAEGYKRLIDEFGYTQAQLANSVGKSRSHIANTLRLNGLPDSIKAMVNEGKISMGHARCLLGVDDAEDLASKIIANDLNVRQAEELARRRSNHKSKDRSANNKEEAGKDDDFIMLGQSLSEKLGVKVVVENSWNGGKISIHYSNLEELDAILMRLN